MNAPFSQAGRLGKLYTVLGKDKLVLLRFTGMDQVNNLFDYRVEALSLDPEVDFDALLGTHAQVEIKTRKGESIWFDGIVTRAVWAGVGENGNRYDLELRPWVWLAGKRRTQRIFHNMDVRQILKDVFSIYDKLGDPHVEDRLTGDYPVLEYTVQYRESDLDFAKRLMERFGISYHFRHDNGSHTLVLIDDIDEYPEIPGGARPYFGVNGHHQADQEHFWEFLPERNITTGGIRLTDYNFKKPKADMESAHENGAPHAMGDIESFDYPGDYLEQKDGSDVLAPLRVAQERSQDSKIRALGDIATLKSGHRIAMTGQHLPSLKAEPYTCLMASHSYVSDSYGSGGVASDPYSYKGQYVLQPVSAPLSPTRQTPVPVVHGPQTAVVVGEGEIDCDEFGRILVHFHWDLAKAYSMRCRVSQNWASKGWGGMIIPRIGMEVVVEFLEGDPDKPLVSGCVYNGKNSVPYDLPGNKTVSTFKSDTHQGGGYNEFRFEDQAGREEVFMHAQKDHNTIIENDESHSIGHDRSKSVGNDQSESIGHDKTISVGNNHTESIGNDMVYNVGRNQQENYGKDHIHRVGNSHKQSIFADHMYETGRNFEGEVFGRFTLDVGESITNNTKVHTLMAFQKMQVKGPGGKITIDSSGITLEAPTIWLKGNVIMGGSGGAQVPTLQMAAREGLPLCEECASFDEEKA